MRKHAIQRAGVFLALAVSSQALAGPFPPNVVQAINPFAVSIRSANDERGAKKRQPIDPQELRRLFQQNDNLASRLKDQGMWGIHAALIDQWVQAIWRTKERPTEADLFFKQLLVDVTRYPPDDPRCQKALLETLRYRYSLTDDQVKLFTSWFNKKKHELFVRDIKVLVPTAGEIVVTRLANKPFTPEQVSKWMKALRPVVEQWWSEVSEELTQLSSEHLTAMQQNMVKSDLGNLDRRFKGIFRSARQWEQGDWTPEMWGLENDPVHIPLQVKLTQERQAKALANTAQTGSRTTTTMASQLGYAVTTQPLRVGDGDVVTRTEAVEP